jgi:UDP-N-acetylmuramoyl-tripeptide--D-alanyl-D-alanine ligase
MFITEAISIFLVFITNNKWNFIFIKLCILNIISPIIALIANFLNYPIESLGKRYYINQAKKILKDMPNLLVIGVTGSYGKTSVKNFFAKALSSKYEVLTTPQNYNTTMGVVKTIRENLKPIHQIFVCEMGATNIGDIKEICDIVKPKIGIITSIGPQHLESFKTIDNIIKTKFELANSVEESGGITFLNYDNEYLARQEIKNNVLTYGVNNENLDYNSYNLTSSSRGICFSLLDKKLNKEIEFKTKLIGKHNVINLTAAISVANYLGIPLDKLVHSVREIKSVEHRLQLVSHGDVTIIDDSYNSNPISSKSALDTLAEFEGTKIIVTPGLIELGGDEKKYNFEFGKYMTDICDYIFLVNSKSAKSILDGIYSTNFSKDKIFNVNTPEEAVAYISKLHINDKITVLLENDLPDNYNL